MLSRVHSDESVTFRCGYLSVKRPLGTWITLLPLPKVKKVLGAPQQIPEGSPCNLRNPRNI
jgi:hypothetical protein